MSVYRTIGPTLVFHVCKKKVTHDVAHTVFVLNNTGTDQSELMCCIVKQGLKIEFITFIIFALKR